LLIATKTSLIIIESQINKDLEQLVVVKELGIKYFIAFDRYFEVIEEYRTPREFVLGSGLEPFERDY
jgi:hypothetical protein